MESREHGHFHSSLTLNGMNHLPKVMRKFLLRIRVCYLQIYSHLQRIPTVDHGAFTTACFGTSHGWPVQLLGSMAQVGIEAPVAVVATNEARSVDPLESSALLNGRPSDPAGPAMFCLTYGPEFKLFIVHHFSIIFHL